MKKRGQISDVTKKYNAGTNKQQHSVPNANKLLESDDVPPAKIVDHKVGMAIQKARSQMGLSQKQLAERICVKQTVIADFESGNAVVDHSVLSKLERCLKVHLRGSHIGEPMIKTDSKTKDHKIK